MKTHELKNKLLKGETIELINQNQDVINLWFQRKTNNFCLELNAVVIKATKTFNPIWSKLTELADANPNNSIIFYKVNCIN